jgi:hypothetical protein
MTEPTDPSRRPWGHFLGLPLYVPHLGEVALAIGVAVVAGLVAVIGWHHQWWDRAHALNITGAFLIGGLWIACGIDLRKSHTFFRSLALMVLTLALWALLVYALDHPPIFILA